MYHSSRKPLTRVGLISTAPMRLAGLYGAFENHPYVQIVFGDLEGILADSALGFLILDVCCGKDGLSIHSRVQEIRPDMRRIVLGPAEDDEVILRYLEGGARAYLDLNAGPLAVRQAVEAVTDGLIWAPRRVLSKLIDRLMNRRLEVVIPRAKPTFSPRERQVLDLIMTASSNREIASELGIEERTVKAYVASLMRKTGVDNRVSLSVMAVQGALLEKEAVSPSTVGG
jgi:DNA-binding NarL/FixJ family response regulator